MQRNAQQNDERQQSIQAMQVEHNAQKLQNIDGKAELEINRKKSVRYQQKLRLFT